MWKSQGFRLDPAAGSRNEAGFMGAKVGKWAVFQGFAVVALGESAPRLTIGGAKGPLKAFNTVQA
jgi:hypothetical protein